MVEHRKAARELKPKERIPYMSKESNISQQQKILFLLESQGSATVREIFIKLNINSPTKRLSELRKQGLIREESDFSINTEGRKVWFKRYFLANE